MPIMKLFLSCVSSEFKSYRLKLANHLAVTRGGSFEVKVQEDFQQGGFTLLEQLADYIRDCDLVVHLVGDAFGARWGRSTCRLCGCLWVRRQAIRCLSGRTRNGNIT